MMQQVMDGVPGHLLPDLDQGMTELLDCLRCNLVALDVENIMSQRCSFAFKSGEHGWPVIGISSFILQKLPAYCHHHTRPGIVHQKECRTHCSSVGPDSGSKDFIPISNVSQGNVPLAVEVDLPILEFF